MIATFALLLSGQATRLGGEGANLKRALSLSDSQFVQLQQERFAGLILNNSQKKELETIKRFLPRWQTAAGVIARGFINAPAWSGATLCVYPDIADLLQGEIGVTAAQRLQLTGLVQNHQNTDEHSSLRERMLDLLTDAQKQKLEAFELSIQLAEEAIKFGLIPRPVGGGILCN